MSNPFETILCELAEVRKENAEIKALLLIVKEQSATVDDEFLTPKQVCAYLGIGLTSRWKYEKDGKIKSERIGGKILYRKSELDKILKQ